MSTSRPPGDSSSTGGGRRRVLTTGSNSSSNVVAAQSPTLPHRPASSGTIRAKVDINSLNSPPLASTRSNRTTTSSSSNTGVVNLNSSSTTATPRGFKPTTRVTPQSTPFARSSPTVSTPLQQRATSPIRQQRPGARSPQQRPPSSASSTPSATPELRGQSDEFPSQPPLLSHLPSSVSLRAIHSPATTSSLRASVRGAASSPPPKPTSSHGNLAASTSATAAARYSSASSSSAGTNRSTPLTSPTFEPKRVKHHGRSIDLSSPSSTVSPLPAGKATRRPPVAGSGASSATSTPTLVNTRPPRRRVSSDSGTTFAPIASSIPAASSFVGGTSLLPPLALSGGTASPTLRTATQRPPIWSPTLMSHAQNAASQPMPVSIRSPSANSGASSSSYEDRADTWSRTSTASTSYQSGTVPRTRAGADGSGRGSCDSAAGQSEGGGASAGGYDHREIVLGDIDWSVEADRLESEMKAEREQQEELEKAKIEAERAKKEAQRQRKILDLEISNTSLLTINSSLERIKSLQTKEIRDLRRRLRESNVGDGLGSGMLSGSSRARRALAAFRANERIMHGATTGTAGTDDLAFDSDYSSGDDDDDEPEQTWDEILEADEQFSAIAGTIERLVRNGQAAIESKVDRKTLEGVGGRVLNVVEMEERRRSLEDEQDDVKGGRRRGGWNGVDGFEGGRDGGEVEGSERSDDSGSGSDLTSGASTGSATASVTPADSEDDNVEEDDDDDDDDVDGDDGDDDEEEDEEEHASVGDHTRMHGLGIRYSLD